MIKKNLVRISDSDKAKYFINYKFIMPVVHFK